MRLSKPNCQSIVRPGVVAACPDWVADPEVEACNGGWVELASDKPDYGNSGCTSRVSTSASNSRALGSLLATQASASAGVISNPFFAANCSTDSYASLHLFVRSACASTATGCVGFPSILSSTVMIAINLTLGLRQCSDR